MSLRRFESLSLFRKAGSPYLHARWTLDEKRAQVSTKETRIEAAWTQALRLYQDAKKRARGEEPECTVGELARLWVMAHALLLSSDHVGAVERFGKRHLFNLADLLLSKVTTTEVEAARVAYLQNHAKRSANTWLTYLRLLFGWAIRRRMIRERPWQVRPLKVQSKPKQLLPVDKAADWLQAVDVLAAREPAIALAIRIMIGLGLRCESEALNARWEWLDLERGTYTPGLTKGKEAWARPVPGWVVDLLRPVALPWGLIVPTAHGKALTPGRIQRVMDAACDSVGIPRLTPHCLRHTYATLLSEAGVPLQDIQRALGHKDIRTTANYLHVDMGRVAKGQARMADRLQITGRESGAEPCA